MMSEEKPEYATFRAIPPCLFDDKPGGERTSEELKNRQIKGIQSVLGRYINGAITRQEAIEKIAGINARSKPFDATIIWDE